MTQRLLAISIKRLLAIIIVILTLSSARAIEWSGECVRVADGDTITVMYHELPLKIRLYGIDAPERGQDFSRRSKQCVEEMVLHKTVRVEFMGFDNYNRVIGLVSIGDLIVNQTMVERGMAWVFKKYCNDPYLTRWIALEENARERAVGLWVHASPVPPWEHRQVKRNGRRVKTVGYQPDERVLQSVDNSNQHGDNE
ncbi:MAG: thermonuclease family protein [Planctomycetaceae bacterium]|nr:thermonuclease family protein [Planctomycetaceae bacterium]